MFDLDHWREIYTALSANKVRTFLTAFGVFWGILMLMVMLGSGTGLENGVNQDFADNATNSFWVWSQRTSMPYRGLPRGRPLQLTNDDTAAIRERVSEVKVLAPRNQLGGWRGGNNVTRGKQAGAFSVFGDYPQIMDVEPVRITDGRFLNHFDLEDHRKVAVLGPRVAEVLFEPGEEPIDAEDQQEQESIYVPFTTFQKAFNQGNRVNWFAITSQNDVPASIAETKVLTLLRQRHRVHPDDTRAFGHFNLEEEYDQIQGLFIGIRTLIWIVGIGTLAAGVIGVSNIMLVIVRERTHEIGVRRAIGASPGSVMSQIILEAILLTSVAGYIGLIAGMWLMDLTANMLAAGGGQTQMFINPGVDLTSALQALMVLVVAGTLAGIIPARRAVSISPVDALRAD
jgi:putative ABC transport system permease protein